MTNDYGTKIAGALRAIAQLHSDTSKLLVDCDKHIGKGRPSVFGSYATRDLTYNFQATCWMAEGVYRYYVAGAALVDGITVAFFNMSAATRARPHTEPLLLLARIQYSAAAIVRPGGQEDVRGVCKEWDIWELYFSGEAADAAGVLAYEAVDNGRIEWAYLTSVPLFSIRCIEDVTELMDRVVAAARNRGEPAVAST